MNFASLRRWPSAFDFETRSEPARSTRFSFDRVMTSEPAFWEVMVMVKMEWEREDWRFMEVDAIVRLDRPMKRRFCATSSDGARCELSPCTTVDVPRSVTLTCASVCMCVCV